MEEVITVACVEVRNYLGRGALYVERLRSMVARHLARPHRFVCLTDAPARHPGLAAESIHGLPYCDKLSQLLTGWWAKLYLFEPGRFAGRVLYLDLDTVIVGPLEPVVAQAGAVKLTDWGWDRDVTAGGQLVWDAGEHADVWDGAALAPKRYADDQEYLTALGGWDRLPPALLRSYRYHCRSRPGAPLGGPPAGCSVVAFHGSPKPHQVTDGWVPEHWR